MQKINSFIEHMSTEDFIKFNKIQLLKLCDDCVKFIINLNRKWESENRINNITESKAIKQCLLQMASVKAKSILQNSDGILLIGNAHILDISSLFAILRSMYELFFIFHNIYITQENENEREIILSIWEIRGLNNRQYTPMINDKYNDQKENEKKDIDELKKKCRSILDKMNPTDKVKKEFEGILNSKSSDIKGYKFEKSNGTIIDIKDIRMSDGYKELSNFTNAHALYKLTSLHIHPSYISVLNFGQTYNDKTDKEQLSTILTCTYFLLSNMVYDFCTSSDEAHNLFLEIDPDTLNNIESILKNQ